MPENHRLAVGAEMAGQRKHRRTIGQVQRGRLGGAGRPDLLRPQVNGGMKTAVLDQPQEVPHAAHAGRHLLQIGVDVGAVALFAQYQTLGRQTG